jgi:hypothetical protein
MVFTEEEMKLVDMYITTFWNSGEVKMLSPAGAEFKYLGVGNWTSNRDKIVQAYVDRFGAWLDPSNRSSVSISSFVNTNQSDFLDSIGVFKDYSVQGISPEDCKYVGMDFCLHKVPDHLVGNLNYDGCKPPSAVVGLFPTQHPIWYSAGAGEDQELRKTIAMLVRGFRKSMNYYDFHAYPHASVYKSSYYRKEYLNLRTSGFASNILKRPTPSWLVIPGFAGVDGLTMFYSVKDVYGYSDNYYEIVYNEDGLRLSTTIDSYIRRKMGSYSRTNTGPWRLFDGVNTSLYTVDGQRQVLKNYFSMSPGEVQRSITDVFFLYGMKEEGKKYPTYYHVKDVDFFGDTTSPMGIVLDPNSNSIYASYIRTLFNQTKYYKFASISTGGQNIPARLDVDVENKGQAPFDESNLVESFCMKSFKLGRSWPVKIR